MEWYQTRSSVPRPPTACSILQYIRGSALGGVAHSPAAEATQAKYTQNRRLLAWFIESLAIGREERGELRAIALRDHK